MISVATYNILHGYNADLILDNIRFLIQQGADIICLQEADPLFEEPLNALLRTQDNWQVKYIHAGIGGDIAVAWNAARLTLHNANTILLPTRQLALLQRLQKRLALLQRAALAARFSFEGKTLLVTSVHLAWEGGVKHRLAQLRYLRQALSGYPADYEILAGDFNTFAPAAFRGIQAKKVEAILGPTYINALPDLRWSCDTSHAAPQDGWLEPFIKTLYALGIRMRSRLDYIFVRNLKVVSAEMFDLPGSDHRPLIGSFESGHIAQ